VGAGSADAGSPVSRTGAGSVAGAGSADGAGSVAGAGAGSASGAGWAAAARCAAWASNCMRSDSAHASRARKCTCDCSRASARLLARDAHTSATIGMIKAEPIRTSSRRTRIARMASMQGPSLYTPAQRIAVIDCSLHAPPGSPSGEQTVACSGLPVFHEHNPVLSNPAVENIRARHCLSSDRTPDYTWGEGCRRTRGLAPGPWL